VKKTLGIVSYSFLPRIGGCATLARMLARHLPDAGWDVFLIAPVVGEAPSLVGWPDGVPVDWVRTPLATGYESHIDRGAFLAAFTRRIAVRATDADIWLALDFHVSALAAVAGVRKRRPVVAVFGADPLYELAHFQRVRPSTFDTTGRTRPVMGRLLRPGLNVGYRRLDAVVLFSEASRPAAARYTSAPATPIFLAYDAELFDGTAGERAAEPELLVVSRLVPWKGVDRAIGLFGRLLQQVPEARLVIAGDGPLAESLIARSRTQSGVEFRLRVPVAEMPALYRRAWALLHPSAYETFGLVVVEAMASGTPVLANRVPPLPDLIDDGRTGLLLPPEDDEAWIEAMLRVLLDRDYAEGLAAEASVQARSRFRVEGMIELYDELLRGLLQ
jgi:glycosyltransferase involved in cell wall biosynthesis